MSAKPTRAIVVGIDGSEESTAALRFALEEAALRGSEIRAVAAWDIPAGAYGYGDGLVLSPPDFDELARDAQGRAQAALASVDIPAGVDVKLVAREGHAADVLVQEAEGAELLVVGSRGLGGFKGLLLGSVSHHCVHHAACPVVVVKGAG
jgi:nucleotide-binding universal stress UspA family protein